MMTQVVPTCAKWGWLGLLAGILMACSGPGFDPPATAGNAASESGGMLAAGGSTDGGILGSGGVGLTGGAWATGGDSATGGFVSTGGADSSGGSMETGGDQVSDIPGGCRVNPDCEGMEPRCLRPGETYTPPPNCGAIGWCGECECPAQPQFPVELGSACQRDADCQGQSPNLLCSPEGVCTMCGEDADCAGSTPRCSTPVTLNPWGALPIDLRRCVQCGSHSDCGGLTPACDTTPAEDGWPQGRCVECAADVPCASGVCQQGMCVPECSDDAQCGEDGLQHCSSANRCEPTPCGSDAECGALGLCSDGRCERRACTDDSTCGPGHACVQGECFAAGGSCVDTYVLPVP